MRRILSFALAVLIGVTALQYPASAAVIVEDLNYPFGRADYVVNSNLTYTKTMRPSTNSTLTVKSPYTLTIEGYIFLHGSSKITIEPGARVVIAPGGSLELGYRTVLTNGGELVNEGSLYGTGFTLQNNGSMINTGRMYQSGVYGGWGIQGPGRFDNYGDIDSSSIAVGADAAPNEITGITAAFSASENKAEVEVTGRLPQGANSVYIKLFDQHGGDTISPSRDAVLASADGATAAGSLGLPVGPVPSTYTVKAGFDGVHWATATGTVTTAAPIPAPVIAVQGGGTEISQGGSLTLEVTNTSDYNTPSYRWSRDGAAVGADDASLAATEAGTYKVAVTVDGQRAGSNEITLTDSSGGSNDFKTLTLGPMPDVEIEEGERWRMQVPVTVSGRPHSSVAYRVTGLPLGLNYDAGGLISGVPVSGTAGEYPVEVTVSADSLSASGRFRLTVTDSGVIAPRLHLYPMDDAVAKTGSSITIALGYSYTGGSALSWSAGNVPPGLTISGQGGIVTGTPTQIGTYGVAVEVSDGTLRDSRSFTVRVEGDRGGSGTNPVPGPNSNGDSGRSGDTSGPRASSGSASAPAKASIPASAFDWDGVDTLTIDHERVTPLGLLLVRWSGEPLTPGSDYEVYEGSVVIRFGADFIRAQSSGEHDIQVDFLNHYGETTVTVGRGATSAEDGPYDDAFDDGIYNPNTGDGFPPLILLALMSCFGGLAVWTRRKRG